jgi:hypothetical protein
MHDQRLEPMKTDGTKSDALGSVFWLVTLGAFSIPGATLGGYWIFVGVSRSPWIFHSAMVLCGTVLLFLVGIYGTTEIVQRLCHRRSLFALPLATFVAVIATLSGALLLANGLRAIQRPSATRSLLDSPTTAP